MANHFCLVGHFRISATLLLRSWPTCSAFPSDIGLAVRSCLHRLKSKEPGAVYAQPELVLPRDDDHGLALIHVLQRDEMRHAVGCFGLADFGFFSDMLSDEKILGVRVVVCLFDVFGYFLGMLSVSKAWWQNQCTAFGTP